MQVLVVDDSRTQLYGIERMLKSVGVRTMLAENGKQGILMARHKLPDLILMDIVMPEINGFQATRYLTRQAETQHIPIIIISGSDQESDKAWGLKLGARDYLSKPVNKDLLLTKICQVLVDVSSSESLVRKPDQSSMARAV
ncbi:MAG: response regulator [Gammaproteobacteria bacterium]|nr:response regulator [Gammaproteobacteria bacterium]